MIFLDTPGIHHDANVQYGSQKSDDIHTRINAQAFAGLREADVILRLVDPTRPYGAEDERIDTALSYNTKPVIRVETKQDLDKGYLGKDIDYKIDSINHIGFEELITAIATKLPDGPYLYEADQYTDQTMELRVTEVIREILFEELGEELPYACYVEIGSIENTGTMLKIQAYLNVEAESQKLIIIGK
jgi:GTP-binding protein Era